jgi:hypothetical protein
MSLNPKSFYLKSFYLKSFHLKSFYLKSFYLKSFYLKSFYLKLFHLKSFYLKSVNFILHFMHPLFYGVDKFMFHFNCLASWIYAFMLFALSVLVRVQGVFEFIKE